MPSDNPTLVESLLQLRDYIQSKKDYSGPMPRDMYSGQLARLNRNFRLTDINDTYEIQDAVSQVLVAAEIKPKDYGRFINIRASLSGYDFLQELLALKQADQENHDKIQRFIQEIDALEAKKRKRIFYASLFILAMVALASPAFITKASTIFEALISIGSFIPIVGICFTTSVGAYSFYQTIHNKKLSFYEKFRDNLFLLSEAALNITAGAILIASAATANPIAGFLYIGASMVTIAYEITRLVALYKKIKEIGPIKPEDPLDMKQDKLRMKAEQRKIARDLAVNLAVAVGIAGIIAAWSFAPGGMFISIAAIGTIGVLFGIKILAAKLNTKRSRKALAKQFQSLDEEEQKRHEELDQEAKLTPENEKASYCSLSQSLKSTKPLVSEVTPQEGKKELKQQPVQPLDTDIISDESNTAPPGFKKRP